MDKNMYDMAFDELLRIGVLVKQELTERFGKVNPFRMQAVKKEDLLYHYTSLNPNNPSDQQFMNSMIQKHGADVVNGFIMDMEKMINRRNK